MKYTLDLKPNGIKSKIDFGMTRLSKTDDKDKNSCFSIFIGKLGAYFNVCSHLLSTSSHSLTESSSAELEFTLLSVSADDESMNRGLRTQEVLGNVSLSTFLRKQQGSFFKLIHG